MIVSRDPGTEVPKVVGLGWQPGHVGVLSTVRICGLRSGSVWSSTHLTSLLPHSKRQCSKIL